MAVTVVHTTRTNHILAAIDTAGPAGPPPTLDQLVGPGLPLPLSRTPGAGGGNLQRPRVLVATEHLAAAAAERVAGLLNRPMTFGIGPGRTPTPLSPWTAGNVPVELRADGVHLMLDRTSTGQPTRVLVVLAGPGRELAPADEAAQVTLFGQVFTGRKAATIGAALERGWYTVLTLAEGWHGRLEPLEVT